MANEVAGFFETRDQVYAAQPNAAALRALGKRALDQGLLERALECFTKGTDAEGLGQVAAAARAVGDTFAYEAALKALGRTAPADEWVAVGETALAAGLLWFAYHAFEKADRQEALERVRSAMFAAGVTTPGDVH